MTPADQDWLAICRRASAGVEAALERYPQISDRSEMTGSRGEGEPTRLGDALQLRTPIIVRYITDYRPQYAEIEIGRLRELHVGVLTTPSDNSIYNNYGPLDTVSLA